MKRENTNYTKKVMDHFSKPRNMGELKNPDAEATVGNPICGDVMKIMLKIDKAPSFRKRRIENPCVFLACSKKRGSLESENLDRRNVEPSQMRNYKIKDIKFQTMGCAAAIANSSMLTVLAKGKTIEEAKKITNRDVAVALGGLPPIKIHCSNLAADALKNAIENWEEKNKN